MSPPKFKEKFEPHYGQVVELYDGISRITAPNSSPFTFKGTNSYLIGDKNIALIDPGPEDDSHRQAIIKALEGKTLSHIFITHTHKDHSPLAAFFAQKYGAKIYAEGKHRPSRALNIGENNPLDASADHEFAPDVYLKHGDVVDCDGFQIEAVFTPGHCANHMAFALLGRDIIFSGDHVMAWATSIVAPPDGAMADYMASLQVFLDRPEQLYLPGHGGRVENGHHFVRGLKAHRKMREMAVLDRIRKGDETIPDMVKVIYQSTDPRLHGAAALSVLAHLEDLVARGQVETQGNVSIDAHYFACQKD